MKTTRIAILGTLFLFLVPLTAPNAAGQRDTLDGPVIADATIALKTGELTPVLKWVPKDSEKELRDSFSATLRVRALSDDARKIADMYFSETLVRLHRAGEGEPFTGLKPAGTGSTALIAADQALADGSIADLTSQISKSVEAELRSRFAEVIEKKKHANTSVEAGRAYAAAYVRYAHYVEALHAQSSGASAHHQARASDKHHE